MSSQTKLFVYGLGIFVCYFYFGILQEKITRGQYVAEITREDGRKENVSERYTYVLVLVFLQCLVNYCFAKFMLLMWPAGEDTTPTIYKASAALTYLLAMVSSNTALRWVAYPTQVVGKAAKPIPVLLLGVLVGKKSYPLRKYMFTIMIVAGVALFMYKEKGPASTEGGIGLGELLLILSLTMDGLTGAVQERMRAEAKPTGQQMMKGMNGWSCLYLAAAIVLSGELNQFLQFVSRHPVVLTHILLLAIAGTLGQLFIFLTVTQFGPLPCSIITTTRKFFTVLGSVILFSNKLIPRQWWGAVLVFTGLFCDAYYSKSAPKIK